MYFLTRSSRPAHYCPHITPHTLWPLYGPHVPRAIYGLHPAVKSICSYQNTFSPLFNAESFIMDLYVDCNKKLQIQKLHYLLFSLMHLCIAMCSLLFNPQPMARTVRPRALWPAFSAPRFMTRSPRPALYSICLGHANDIYFFFLSFFPFVYM